MNVSQEHDVELDSGLVGFTVVGRDEEPIGEVMRVSGDGVCLLVAGRHGLIRRNKEHAIHRSVITDIDADILTITIAATREHVEQAPEYSNLDPRGSEKLASHYT